MCQQLACLRWWKVTRVTFIWLVFPLTLTAIVFLIFLFATYQAHRLLTSGLKAHKVVHASLGSRFGQQDLYLPILIEILMIYFFQYGSFGGSVPESGRVHRRPHAFSLARGLNKNSSKWKDLSWQKLSWNSCFKVIQGPGTSLKGRRELNRCPTWLSSIFHHQER